MVGIVFTFKHGKLMFTQLSKTQTALVLSDFKKILKMENNKVL